MEMSYDYDTFSILTSAATNKNPGVFATVMSCIEKDLTHQEVQNNIDSEFLPLNVWGSNALSPDLDNELNIKRSMQLQHTLLKYFVVRMFS